MRTGVTIFPGSNCDRDIIDALYKVTGKKPLKLWHKDNEVPTSVMANDLLTTYKLGWKTSYYQNTYDAKSDVDEPTHTLGWHDNVEEEPKEIILDDQEECEACAI